MGSKSKDKNCSYQVLTEQVKEERLRERRNLYDNICAILTNYENGCNYDYESEMYCLLVDTQNMMCEEFGY